MVNLKKNGRKAKDLMEKEGDRPAEGNEGRPVEEGGRSKVERLVDIMFSDAEVPAESMEKMRWWLSDPDAADEKSDALYEKFRETFRFNSEPVLAPQMWPELARRLGIDEAPVIATLDPLEVGMAALGQPGQTAQEVSEPAAEQKTEQKPQHTQTHPETKTQTERQTQRRKLSFRRIAPRVAAVLLPVAVVIGVAVWLSGGPESNLVEVSVPAGSTRTVTLPDGSRVEAASGTTISYDSETFADNRLVTLTGEALFDVVAATDENGARVPFTVEADNLTVNVLGTIFRLVDGIEGVDTAAVSLYRGNVEVAIENDAEPERLFAGERLRVDTRTGDHGTELIPASEMAFQGVMPLLRFEGATLGDLLLALELNHDVAITLDEGIDPSQGSYTADFEGMELDGVLRRVLDGTGLTHRIDGRNVLVTRQQVKIDDGVGAISAIWREVDAGESVMTRIVTFRSGSSVPQTDFMDNTRAIKELDNSLTDTATLARIDHISVTAASSPDGNTAGNERLAIARAQSTKGYLLKRYPHIAPGKVYTFSVGEEWSGLRKLVAEDLRTPDRDEVLALLDAVDDEKIRDTLRTISGGRAWRYIAARLLPRLRGATAVTLHFWDGASERRNDTVSVNNDIAAGTGVQRVEIVAAKPPKPQPVEEPVIEISKPVFSPLFAFKTNFLFDAVGALNLEIEVPLSERWSLAAEGMFPWWWTANGTIEGRYWLGDRSLRPVLTGWFGGIYAGGGWYDFTRNERTHKGDFFHAGLSGGYAHMINRRGNLRMEYALGLGYLYTSGGRNWWGPTRGKVSLVWILEKRTTPSN